MKQASDSFDAYYLWLGIPREKQPPNHYQRLGVRNLEDNLDVIDNAAEQRMTFLRNHQFLGILGNFDF